MKQTVAVGEQIQGLRRRDRSSHSNRHLFLDSVRAFLMHHLLEWKPHPGHIVTMPVVLLLVTAYSIFIHAFYGTGASTFQYFKPLARSPYDESATACYPLGIHLATHSDVDDNDSVKMTVSFYLPFLPCKDAHPAVSYGRKGNESESMSALVPDPLHLKYASKKTMSKTFLSDWVYHVTIPKLKAGEQDYCATSIAIVADLGDTDISQRTIQGMEEASSDSNKIPASLAVVAGDLSYADGKPYVWSQWFQHSESLFRHLPLSVSVGNHEIECDINTLEVFGNYEMWFRMPNRRDDERKAMTPQYKASFQKENCIHTRFQADYHYGKSFYAYRHGSVHVVVLNPYSSYAPSSIQFNWLLHELRDNVDRTKTPWVMAVTHNPLYSTFKGHKRHKDATAMEVLFNMYGVNVVISGHDHGYMRSRSLTMNATMDESGKAPVYFIVGTGGSKEGPPAYGYKYESEMEPITAARSHRVTGFGQLTIYNATHALWEFHANQIEAEDWYSTFEKFTTNTKRHHNPWSTTKIVYCCRITLRNKVINNYYINAVILFNSHLQLFHRPIHIEMVRNIVRKSMRSSVKCWDSDSFSACQ